MPHPLPRRGPVSTGTSWGERSGAPAAERFPTFAYRGVPGGTVGTTTGRPQGLNPAPMLGVAPAGRRKKNRRGGRSASAPEFRGLPHGIRRAPATPSCLQQEARQGSKKCSRPGAIRSRERGSVSRADEERVPVPPSLSLPRKGGEDPKTEAVLVMRLTRALLPLHPCGGGLRLLRAQRTRGEGRGVMARRRRSCPGRGAVRQEARSEATGNQISAALQTRDLCAG